MQQIKIILVEPAGALNVGSVARVMKNMGLNQLVLVAPHCNPKDPQARQMAVHGMDVLENAQIVATLPEALQGCQRAIATTSKSRTLSTPLETPRLALPWLLDKDFTSALIFGPEDRGLNNQELNYAQRLVCIPANDEYSSLNLAQAVAVCLYELYQADIEQQTTPKQPSKAVDVAPLDALESYYQHLESVLLKISYLYPHTAKSRMAKFRHIYHRANLTTEELALLRGVLSQIEWAVKSIDN